MGNPIGSGKKMIKVAEQVTLWMNSHRNAPPIDAKQGKFSVHAVAVRDVEGNENTARQLLQPGSCRVPNDTYISNFILISLVGLKTTATSSSK